MIGRITLSVVRRDEITVDGTKIKIFAFDDGAVTFSVDGTTRKLSVPRGRPKQKMSFDRVKAMIAAHASREWGVAA